MVWLTEVGSARSHRDRRRKPRRRKRSAETEERGSSPVAFFERSRAVMPSPQLWASRTYVLSRVNRLTHCLPWRLHLSPEPSWWNPLMARLWLPRPIAYQFVAATRRLPQYLGVFSPGKVQCEQMVGSQCSPECCFSPRPAA